MNHAPALLELNWNTAWRCHAFLTQNEFTRTEWNSQWIWCRCEWLHPCIQAHQQAHSHKFIGNGEMRMHMFISTSKSMFMLMLGLYVVRQQLTIEQIHTSTATFPPMWECTVHARKIKPILPMARRKLWIQTHDQLWREVSDVLKYTQTRYSTLHRCSAVLIENVAVLIISFYWHELQNQFMQSKEMHGLFLAPSCSYAINIQLKYSCSKWHIAHSTGDSPSFRSELSPSYRDNLFLNDI